MNPHLLIAVQGLDVYRGQYGLWGGVFLGQLDAPLNLTVPNKLIFQTHDLGPSTFNQVRRRAALEMLPGSALETWRGDASWPLGLNTFRHWLDIVSPRTKSLGIGPVKSDASLRALALVIVCLPSAFLDMSFLFQR